MFTLAGLPDPSASSGRVVKLEMALAKAQWSKVENRDRDKTYNKIALAGMAAAYPGFNWKAYADAAGFGTQTDVRVYQPTYLKALGSLFTSAPLADWKTYYTWRLLSGSAPYLSAAFVQEDFAFSEKTIQGIQEMRPRWKRGVSAVEDAMGEQVGKVYVERHFKPEAKERMVRLVANLRTRSANGSTDWNG